MVRIPKNITQKDLVVFDLDGTLAASKAPMAKSMARLLVRLLATKKVAVIGGGTYAQFKHQLVEHLECPPKLLADLFLFPTNATAFYRYRGGWKKVYAHGLTRAERTRIRAAFAEAFKAVQYHHPAKTYGKIIEDRGTQMTFSALGQDVVDVLGVVRGVRAKEEWNRTDPRPKIMNVLSRLLPGFEVRRGGLTSIDVTRKGIDKAYGIRTIERILKVPRSRMLFVGDAIYPGGNDYAVVKTGVQYVRVDNPRDTAAVIRRVLEG